MEKEDGSQDLISHALPVIERTAIAKTKRGTFGCFPSFKFTGKTKQQAGTVKMNTVSAAGVHRKDLPVAGGGGALDHSYQFSTSDQELLLAHTSVQDIFCKYDVERALVQISTGKWRISEEGVGEKVLNALQALRSTQYHLPAIALKYPGILTEVVTAHKCIFEALPKLIDTSTSSVLVLLESTHVALNFLDLFATFLNAGPKKAKEVCKIISESWKLDIVTAKKIWVTFVKQTKSRLKRLKPELQVKNAPLLILNSNLGLLEMAILALRDPNEKSKAVLAFGKVLIGVGKSVATMSLDQNLLGNLATFGGMAVDKIKQHNANRIYISIHKLNRIKSEIINSLCTVEGSNVQRQEEIKRWLRSLQADIMINPSVDLCSRFVELIYEILLGPQPIQLKKKPHASPENLPAPATSLRVGYSIIHLDGSFALWLINGDESNDTSFLGLKGFSSLGLKPNYTPDPSIRIKAWGKAIFKDLVDRKLEIIDSVSLLRDVIEVDFCENAEEFRDKLQNIVQQQGVQIFEGLITEFFRPLCKVFDTSGEVFNDEPADDMFKTIDKINPAKLLTHSQADDVCSIIESISNRTMMRMMFLSEEKLNDLEASISKGKELIVQVRTMSKELMDILKRGTLLMKKSRKYLAPAVNMLLKIQTIADAASVTLFDGRTPEIDEVFLVLKSTVDLMMHAQFKLDQNIDSLEKACIRVDEIPVYLDDTKVQQVIDGLSIAVRSTRETPQKSYPIGERVRLVMGLCARISRKTLSMCTDGENLITACQTSRQLLAYLQCKPIKIIGADALNGVYVPKIDITTDKVKFVQNSDDRGFVLFYEVTDDVQRWCIGTTESEDSSRLWSDSEVELPHLIDNDSTVWTKNGYEIRVRIDSVKSTIDKSISLDFSEQAMTQLQDARDGILSAASDLLGDALAQSEEAFSDVKEELNNAVEDLEDIQDEVADLITPFKPFTDVATGAFLSGWAVLKQQSSQKQHHRVRASNFFVLVKLKTCLTNAIAARAKGIGSQSRLDLSAVLKAVDALIVRMSSLETDRRMKSHFKTASFAAESWNHCNSGWRDFTADARENVDLIDSLIDEIAQEQDPSKKINLVVRLDAEKQKMSAQMTRQKNGTDILYNMLVNQAQSVASMRNVFASKSSAVSKDAWDDQKQHIQNSLRENLENLKKKQEKIEDQAEADVDMKQTILMELRQEQLGIMVQLSNVEDVGSGLGITVSFLQGMQGQLDVINNKLDELASAVKDMADNLRLLVGRPVMEVLETRRTELILKRKELLAQSVYIPSECLEAGEDYRFTEKDHSDRKLLMSEIQQFLASEGSSHYEPEGLSRKGAMLIHGPAGSGKSSFARELEIYIQGELYDERKKQGVNLVLIKSQLQTLQKPLTEIFDETLRRQYGLKKVQIDSLKDKIRDETDFEVIFLLDGYDEMRLDFRGKNLFTTNNLEQYRSSSKAGLCTKNESPYCFPKVIFLSRSELFAGKTKTFNLKIKDQDHKIPEYIKPFLPVEADNPKKDEVHEAFEFYHELKLASFESCMKDFLALHCALTLRKKYEERCGHFRCDPRAQEILKASVRLAKEINQERTEGSGVEKAETLKAINAMANALIFGDERAEKGMGQREDNMAVDGIVEGTDDPKIAKKQMEIVISMLEDFRRKMDREGKAGLTEAEQRELIDDAFESDVWTKSMFEFRIKCVSGLKELTSTPFMVSCVVDIMPVLFAKKSTPSDVKHQMLLLTSENDEAVVERTWALLLKEDTICSTVTGLSKTQDTLKEDHSTKAYQNLYTQLKNISKEIIEHFAKNSSENPSKLKEDELLQILLKVLEETVTRRYSVYAVFIDQWVSKQAAIKSVNRAIPLSLDQVISEVWTFMQRLASLLVESGLSKVQYDPANMLFAKEDEFSQFFDLAEETNHRGEVRRLALDVSPIVKEGSFFSFIHKSVLEFLVAKQMRDDIIDCINRTRLSPARLSEIWLYLLGGQPAASSAVLIPNIFNNNLTSFPLPSLTHLTPQLPSFIEQSVAPKFNSLQELLESKLKNMPHRKGKNNNSAADTRRDAKALVAFVADARNSSLNKVDLHEEEAVRDFVIDCLLEDVEFCTAFKLMASLCKANTKEAGFLRLHGGMLLLAHDNIRVTCMSTNVKRGGGNILHAAAREGNMVALKTVIGPNGILDVKRIDLYYKCLEQEQDLSHHAYTPLLVAAAFGHVDAVQWLLGAKANLFAQDSNGCTALSLAAAKGHVSVINVLLRGFGNRKDDSQDYRNLPGGSRLPNVQDGRDIRNLLMLSDKKGRSCLHHATIGHNAEVAKLLMGAGGPKLWMHTDRSRRTCLHEAAYAGDLEMVMALTDGGEKCKPTVGHGIQNNGRDLLMLTDRNGMTCFGITAMKALTHSDMAMVDLKIDDEAFRKTAPGLKWEDVGSDKPISGIEIVNAALTAALQQTIQFTKEELDRFNVSGLSYDSYIMLGNNYFKPVETGFGQCLKWLIEGVNRNREERLYPNSEEKIGLFGYNFTQQDRLLVMAETGLEDLFQDVSSDNTFDWLLTAANTVGMTQLMLACANGHLKIAKDYFVQHMEQNPGHILDFLKVEDKKGRTCLHWAAMNGHFKLAEELANLSRRFASHQVDELLDAPARGGTWNSVYTDNKSCRQLACEYELRESEVELSSRQRFDANDKYGLKCVEEALAANEAFALELAQRATPISPEAEGMTEREFRILNFGREKDKNPWRKV